MSGNKREAKIQYSIKLPPGYDRVVDNAIVHLKAHPNLVGKMKGHIIFLSDVFRWSLDMLADYLEIDLKIEKNTDLVFVDAEKKKKSKRLFILLSSMDFNILEEYIHQEYEKRGVDVFEFCDEKGIDWKEILRADEEKRSNIKP